MKNDKYIDKFLSYIDLLIDGGFEQDKFDLSRPWVGSSNQRYIFLTDRFNQEIINQFKNRVEIRINKYGKVEMNGMGDFKNLQENFCLHLGADKV